MRVVGQEWLERGGTANRRVTVEADERQYVSLAQRLRWQRLKREESERTGKRGMKRIYTGPITSEIRKQMSLLITHKNDARAKRRRLSFAHKPIVPTAWDTDQIALAMAKRARRAAKWKVIAQ